MASANKRSKAKSPPFNVNNASRLQLVALPGITPAIARQINSERSTPEGLFKDWADLQARVKGIGKETAAKLESNCLAVVQPLRQAFFDPIADLPSDLAALCLSFLDAHVRLGAAQYVSRSWRNAIDGGLPSVWHDVRLEQGVDVTNDLFVEIASKSHGAVRTLTDFDASRVQPGGLEALRSFANLRVLQITLPLNTLQPFNALLSSFPLLEDLGVRTRCTGAVDFVFPPLHHLKRARCSVCGCVKALCNLPSLTKLEVYGCVEADAPWPTSLREVTLRGWNRYRMEPRIVDRIAALPQLATLSTDWLFVPHSFFAPPYKQLSFLTRLECMSVFFEHHHASLLDALLNYLPAMSALRKVHLSSLAAPWVNITDRDLQCLSQLTSLQTVTLGFITKITSRGLRHVCMLPNLTKLRLTRCTSVKDYSPIQHCSQLRDLCISHDEYRLSCHEADALVRLPRVELLELRMAFQDPHWFSQFCSMSSLRKLVLRPVYTARHNSTHLLIPWTAYHNLHALDYLEELSIIVSSVEETIGTLVQMPQLRRVALVTERDGCFGEEHEARLRAALPRVQELTVRSI